MQFGFKDVIELLYVIINYFCNRYPALSQYNLCYSKNLDRFLTNLVEAK